LPARLQAGAEAVRPVVLPVVRRAGEPAVVVEVAARRPAAARLLHRLHLQQRSIPTPRRGTASRVQPVVAAGAAVPLVAAEQEAAGWCHRPHRRRHRLLLPHLRDRRRKIR
jgi:hypothetical protein